MERKKYYLELNNNKKSEKIIRKFLLDNSDTVRLTEFRWTEIGILKIKEFGGENDKKFASILKSLSTDFIKKIVNNKKYDDISQSKKSKFTHYFYTLSTSIKSKINKESLFWYMGLFSKRLYGLRKFYGFEDPVFYYGKQMIGGAITHENMIFLRLTKPEKKTLESLGIKFN